MTPLQAATNVDNYNDEQIAYSGNEGYGGPYDSNDSGITTSEKDLVDNTSAAIESFSSSEYAQFEAALSAKGKGYNGKPC